MRFRNLLHATAVNLIQERGGYMANNGNVSVVALLHDNSTKSVIVKRQKRFSGVVL